MVEQEDLIARFGKLEHAFVLWDEPPHGLVEVVHQERSEGVVREPVGVLSVMGYGGCFVVASEAVIVRDALDLEVVVHL